MSENMIQAIIDEKYINRTVLRTHVLEKKKKSKVSYPNNSISTMTILSCLEKCENISDIWRILVFIYDNNVEDTQHYIYSVRD